MFAERSAEYEKPPCFGVVILCAGASRRMGRAKALLPWGDATVLEHVMATWRKAGAAQIAVVYDPGNAAVVAELDRLNVLDRIANPLAAEGEMMSSLRAAARWDGWSREVGLVTVSLVDQPRIKADTMRLLAGFAAAASLSEQGNGVIAQPVVEGKRGHPVFFSAKVLGEIGGTTAEHLKEFIHQREELRVFMRTDDVGTVEDMDTPERYEEMRRAEFGNLSSECR